MTKSIDSIFWIAITLLVVSVSCSDRDKTIEPVKEIAEAEIITNDTALLLKYTSGIQSVLEDSKGNTWFGSHEEGVCLFDGEKFTYYTDQDGLSDNQIRTIYEDADGLIWFEGGQGISNYNGQKITTVKDKDYDSKNEWESARDDLWFKGDRMNGYNELEGQPGVYRYDGNTFSYHVFPVKPKSDEGNYYSVTTPFIKGRNGTLWFGTYGAVIGYDDSGFTIIDNERLGLNEATDYLHIRAIYEDSRGRIWIGNNGIGIFLYDGESITHFSEKVKPKKNFMLDNSLQRIFSIAEDEAGNMWFGTVKSGVWRYDGKDLTNFTTRNGLPCDQIWKIYRSKSGEMWFCGANPSGVYRFNGLAFERKF